MPVTVKRYLQGSQLLGNLLSVSGVSSCPTLSQMRRRPLPVRWRSTPARKGVRGRRGGVRGSAEGAEPGCGRFGVVRPVRPRSNARAGIGTRPGCRAGCSGGGRGALAPSGPVDARRGVGVRAQPDRARHGMRRGRAVLQRLRTVVRGRRDRGAGGDASTRRAVRRRAQGRSAGHDEALRRTPEQTGSSEAGRRRGWRRPGPPVVHEPRRARRGAHPSRRLQFNLITARYSPGSLSA